MNKSKGSNYFMFTSKEQLEMDKIAWETYIDILIRKMNEGFSDDEIDSYTERLKELSKYVVDAIETIKETI